MRTGHIAAVAVLLSSPARSQEPADEEDWREVCTTLALPPGPRLAQRTPPPLPQDPPSGTCAVGLTLDDAGAPSLAFDEACPPSWVEAWRTPLAAWRWLPPQPHDPRDGRLLLMVTDAGCPTRTLEHAPPFAYPASLNGTGREAHCRYVLTVGAEGRVTEVRAHDPCPEPFHAAAHEGLMAWRYTRLSDEGDVAVRVHFMDGRVLFGGLTPPVAVFEDDHGDRIALRHREPLDPVLRRGIEEPLSCRMTLRVDVVGHVRTVNVSGCPDLLRKGLQKTARRWLFSPPVSGDVVDVLLDLPTEPLPSQQTRPESPTSTGPRLAHQQAPRPPKEASLYAGERITCQVEVELDRRGRPRDVSVSACPAPFVGPTEQAVGRWRWDGEDLEGVRTRVEVAFGR